MPPGAVGGSPDPGSAGGKTALRRNALAKRRTVPAEDLHIAGERLARVAAPLISALAPRSTVAAYVSMGTEIPTRPLLRLLLDKGFRVIVPRLGRGLDVGWSMLGTMDDLHDVLADGTRERPATGGSDAGGANPKRVSWRPQEPGGAVLGLTALQGASLIIAPTLMVDRSGTRLGRGGGWYDRALGRRSPHALTVAVCWPWEVAEDPLPREAHDIPVDAVLTPEFRFRCGRDDGAVLSRQRLGL